MLPKLGPPLPIGNVAARIFLKLSFSEIIFFVCFSIFNADKAGKNKPGER